MNYNSTYRMLDPDVQGHYLLTTSACGRFEAQAPVQLDKPADWATQDDWTSAIMEAVQECEDTLDWQIGEDARERAE